MGRASYLRGDVMTTKIYSWNGGGTQLEWYEVKDECLRLTSIHAADEVDAVAALDRHFGHPHRVKYDEGDYYEGGCNED